MTKASVEMRKKYADWGLNELADEMSHGPASFSHHAALAELRRREAIWQKDTANATQKSERVMVWSTVGIWITTGLVALFTFLLWYLPQPPGQ